MPENNTPDENLFLKKLEEERLALENNEKKSGEGKKKEKKPHGKVYPLAMFATAFLMFLAIVSLLIFTLTVGGAGNPVLQFFGQNEDTIKTFLINLTNGTFGFLSVFLLITIAVTVFYGFSRKKDELQKRSVAFGLSIVSLFLQFVTIVAWLGMFNFVSSLEVQASELNSEIQMVLKDGRTLTAPIAEDATRELEVPTDIRFVLDNVLKEFEGKGKVLDYIEWDFDNNKSYENRQGKETSVLFRLDRIGTITANARLTATDGSEMIKTITFIIPQGTFAAVPDNGPIPLEVIFDASIIRTPNGNGIVNYEWDFDNDGEIDKSTTSPITTNIFTKIGIYTVHLSAIHRDGTISSFTKKITTSAAAPSVIQGKIQSSIPFTNEAERIIELFVGDEIMLDADNFFSSNGKITRYEWSFSQWMRNRTGKSATLTFTNPGTVFTTLQIWDEQGNQKTEKLTLMIKKVPQKPTVKMDVKPKGGLNVFDATELIVGTEIQLSGAESTGGLDEEIVEYTWDFDGDDVVDATGKEITYTYETLGEKKITLTVENSAGKKESASQFYKILGQELTAVITADPENARAPCTVDLDGSLSSCTDCKILGYEWDFGDGKKSPLTGAQAQHVYNTVGVFPVKLTVHTEDEKATATKNIFCRETQVRACFTASKLVGSAPLKTTFNPECSMGTIVNWQWDFGNDSTSSDQLPTHIFNDAGTYPVTLRVTDNSGNTNEYVLDVTVQ